MAAEGTMTVAGGGGRTATVTAQETVTATEIEMWTTGTAVRTSLLNSGLRLLQLLEKGTIGEKIVKQDLVHHQQRAREGREKPKTAT